jgi:hypothetical protein
MVMAIEDDREFRPP